MPIRNTAVTVEILVWNTDLQIGQINDQANLTLRGVGDGVEYTPGAPAITQIDAVNLKGVYSVSLSAAENNCNVNTIGGISTTADCIIVPFTWVNDQIDFNTTKKASIVTAVWDELTTTHNIVNTFGQMLNNVRANVAQSGTISTIQLDLGASIVNNFYVGNIVFISKGTGIGQARVITAYDGGTKIATVEPNWITAPAILSEFAIFPYSTTATATIVSAILDADLALHLGAGVGFRNIGNILGQLAQSEFEHRTNVFATVPIVAQGISLQMVARGCIQYQRVDMSYTKNWAAPDRTYYLLFHYDSQRRNDMVKASLGTVW